MLVLTPKYSSQIDIDLLKNSKVKTKDSLVKHRNDIIYLNLCKDINEAYLTFLDNKDIKDKYVIGYKPKDAEEISDFVKSLGIIDTLDVSWIDVSELDSLYECFMRCQAIHIVGLEKWDVSNVESMERMFFDCYNLKSIGDISGWDVSNVKDMLSMFRKCYNLNKLGDISGWDVSNVKKMSGMFDYCENLTRIGDINGWKLHNDVGTKDMFYMSRINPRPSWYRP